MEPFPTIAPLFWLKSEEDSILLDGLQQLKNAGINECILEARPHPDWLGEKWFNTLKTLFDFAEKNSMRLWLFDDVHFPSGGAGGKIPEEYRKILVRRRYSDIDGNGGTYTLKIQEMGTEKFFKAICAPFVLPDNFDSAEAFDVTDKVKDNRLTLELPAGRYRVFFIFTTRDGGENHTRNWINMIAPESVDKFIEIALEPHYRELKKYFDNGVCGGFFSDEPRVGSASSYLSLPNGQFPCLPFSFELAKRLENMPAGFWPSLWHECQDAPLFRAKFMDEVSKLYSECFPQKIGRWCNEHNVQYIGHLIEDNGAHCRLGYGDGHFFRALKGQNFSMIDSVLHQNLPGIEDGIHSSSFGPHFSSFYQWGLGKLGSSAGHLYPELNRQCACESFGAYGWNFGLDSMKRMTDHFAVQGINAIVPHAFSNAPFPDIDCPPHFYARGNNPQWKFFELWRKYCSRVCDLLSNGIHISGAAVLYHAEAEWTTRPFTPFEAVGAKLMKAHYDYDVVPFDILKNAEVTDGKMVINGETFNVLIVPAGMLLPQYEEILKRLANDGLPIIFSDEIDEAKKYLTSPIAEGASEFLRIYQYDVDGEIRIFMLNESIKETVEFDMALDASYLYDAVNDVKYAPHKHIRLLPGESIFAVCNAKDIPANLAAMPQNFVKISNSEVLAEDNVKLQLSGEISSAKRTFIEVDQNIGVIEINCNGKQFAPLFAPPYRVEISDCVKSVNDISITVTQMPEVDEAPFDAEIMLKLSMLVSLVQAD